MAGELKTYEAIKPIGKCGACGRDLYPHSSPNICDFRQDCPMHGDDWIQYQSFRRMKNTYVS